MRRDEHHLRHDVVVNHPEQLEAAHRGHLNVQEHDIRALAADRGERLHRVGDLGDDPHLPALLQQQRELLPRQQLVVHHQGPDHAAAPFQGTWTETRVSSFGTHDTVTPYACPRRSLMRPIDDLHPQTTLPHRLHPGAGVVLDVDDRQVPSPVGPDAGRPLLQRRRQPVLDRVLDERLEGEGGQLHGEERGIDVGIDPPANPGSGPSRSPGTTPRAPAPPAAWRRRRRASGSCGRSCERWTSSSRARAGSVRSDRDDRVERVEEEVRVHLRLQQLQLRTTSRFFCSWYRAGGAGWTGARRCLLRETCSC